ncbi:Demethylmenaquinone methyltransferase [hydrothermal vent metagenome]|uniref:Demethylmenaquinone methyltransferase n=1 Tax=hydrothermal vent metagenome TaxID=652676 RepID=A0A3B1BYR6_9ZZZZ
MSASEAKAKAVREMFSGIAHRYDFLNHFLSLGIDITWRKNAVAKFKNRADGKFLDVACGTADLTIALAESAGPRTKITGADFSENMLAVGEEKIKKAGLDNMVSLEVGDALNLKFDAGAFDGVMCAFGVRNFSDLDRGLNEMARVTKSGGEVVILEFTQPTNSVIAAFYRFYFTRVLPFMGGLISGKKSAYEYLPDSVYKFPTPPKLTLKLETAGFTGVTFTPLTFGICGIHYGIKK